MIDDVSGGDGGERYRLSHADMFEVSWRGHGEMIVLTVAGAVDMLTAPLLSEAVLQALTERPAGVVVDLSKVDFLGSAGMTVLVAAHEQITPAGRFAVVAAGPFTARPLHLVGLDTVFAVFDTLDAALADFSG